MPRSMPLSPAGPTTPAPGAPKAAIAAGPSHAADAEAVADYIYELSGQLAGLAGDAGLDLLAYLLDMVRIEADLVKGRAMTAGNQAAKSST